MNTFAQLLLPPVRNPPFPLKISHLSSVGRLRSMAFPIPFTNTPHHRSCRSSTGGPVTTASNRSKNRKPLQKGRNLSIEAIQTIQALKRASKQDSLSLQRTFHTKVKRLLKFDLMAVLRDLLRQNQCHLALQVFEYVRKEEWYKPRLILYGDMMSALASNGLVDELNLIFGYLKSESNLEPDIEGLNVLLTKLVASDATTALAVDCLVVLKQLGCEPDRSSFRILIGGLETKGESSLSAIVKQEAQKCLSSCSEFMEENLDTTVS